jgi:hypothetical protein
MVPDVDATEIPVYGQHENRSTSTGTVRTTIALYNGHLESTRHHRLMLQRTGACLPANCG